MNLKNRLGVRARANRIKPLICKNVIAVIEHPKNPANLESVIPNVNALGAEKSLVISGNSALPRGVYGAAPACSRSTGHSSPAWQSMHVPY